MNLHCLPHKHNKIKSKERKKTLEFETLSVMNFRVIVENEIHERKPIFIM